MRVLHVSHQYPPVIGGSERFMADVSEELVHRGHDVEVATTRSSSNQTWRNSLPSFERLNGVTVRRYRSLERGRIGWHLLKLGTDGFAATRLPFFEPLMLAGNGPWSPGLAWHILRTGRSFDLIHLQTLPYAHVAYGYACARATGRPVVITPHLHVEHSTDFDHAIWNAVLRRADLVVAVSEREIPYLVERGVRSDRILVAGNAVRLESLPRRDRSACRRRLGLPEDAQILLFLGRKVAYKGIRAVVESFHQLLPRFPSLHLLTAGPSTRDSLELVQQFRGGRGWIDLDAVSDETRLDLLNACDVLLLPSTGEAFGIVFLEAWAVGKPVIGARAGAIPWVVDDERDGLLVEPGDVGDLAGAIERLIVDPDLRERLGRNGFAKVQDHYTVEKLGERIERGYGAVLERHQQAQRPTRATSTDIRVA